MPMPRILKHPDFERQVVLLRCPGCRDEPLVVKTWGGTRFVVSPPRTRKRCVRCGATVRPSDQLGWFDFDDLFDEGRDMAYV